MSEEVKFKPRKVRNLRARKESDDDDEHHNKVEEEVL